jgi:hypothetical protein
MAISSNGPAAGGARVTVLVAGLVRLDAGAASALTALAVGATASFLYAAVPLQIYSLYKAGQHDTALQDQTAQRNALPAPRPELT